MDADGFVRLVNLEAAKYVGQGELTHTLCGVPEYMAPEMLLGQGHRTGADWWARLPRLPLDAHERELGGLAAGNDECIEKEG